MNFFFLYKIKCLKIIFKILGNFSEFVFVFFIGFGKFLFIVFNVLFCWNIVVKFLDFVNFSLLLESKCVNV